MGIRIRIALTTAANPVHSGNSSLTKKTVISLGVFQAPSDSKNRTHIYVFS